MTVNCSYALLAPMELCESRVYPLAHIGCIQTFLESVQVADAFTLALAHREKRKN